MRETEIELTVGDVILVGENLLTVIDVEDGEVCFRIDPVDHYADDPSLLRAAPPAK